MKYFRCLKEALERRGEKLNTIIEDSIGSKTGISITSVSAVESQKEDFVRICGKIQRNPESIMYALAPISIVAELLDKEQRVLDVEIWQPINGKFHGNGTFKIEFVNVSRKITWELIKYVRIYLTYN